MRIRKRFPPPSDPQLNKSAVVQLNIKNESLPSDLPNLNLPQPSDQPPVTGVKPTTRWVLFGGNSNQDNLKNKKEVEAEEEDEKLWREKKESFGSKNDNDNKKELSFLSTPQLGSLPPQSSSSSDLDGRWCEEDHKVIPLKKRSRDSYHHQHHHNTSNTNTMKSKTNKKCPPENGNEEEYEQEHYRRINNINSHDKVGRHVNKKSKRGSVILEGSRCSRVNGRGWRCCQQTLVGYSLCEHHLGKGRLRSINSVRNSTNKKKKKKEEEEKEEKSLPNDHEYYDTDDDDDDKKKKKKMKKIGMVKARSLSSLLGQTDNVVATMVVDNDNKNE